MINKKIKKLFFLLALIFTTQIFTIDKTDNNDINNLFNYLNRICNGVIDIGERVIKIEKKIEGTTPFVAGVIGLSGFTLGIIAARCTLRSEAGKKFFSTKEEEATTKEIFCAGGGLLISLICLSAGIWGIGSTLNNLFYK